MTPFSQRGWKIQIEAKKVPYGCGGYSVFIPMKRVALYL
jgi:hypothetical protein